MPHLKFSPKASKLVEPALIPKPFVHVQLPHMAQNKKKKKKCMALFCYCIYTYTSLEVEYLNI